MILVVAGVPLLQIRSEGLQCYTLMSTSHTQELMAKGGSTLLLNWHQENKIIISTSSRVLAVNPEVRGLWQLKDSFQPRRIFLISAIHISFNSELLHYDSGEVLGAIWSSETGPQLLLKIHKYTRSAPASRQGRTWAKLKLWKLVRIKFNNKMQGNWS